MVVRRMKHMTAVRVIYIPEDESGDFGTAFVRLAARVADFQCSEHGEHAALINELNIKHGYQLSATAVGWYFAVITSGLSHDPQLNFLGASLANDIGDYPQIAIA